MSAFLDSNILAYVADQRESDKHATATEPDDAAQDGTKECWISTRPMHKTCLHKCLADGWI